jgi:hypothetical protein
LKLVRQQGQPELDSASGGKDMASTHVGREDWARGGAVQSSTTGRGAAPALPILRYHGQRHIRVYNAHRRRSSDGDPTASTAATGSAAGLDWAGKLLRRRKNFLRGDAALAGITTDAAGSP